MQKKRKLYNKESGVDEMFSLREGLNLEMSKISRGSE